MAPDEALAQALGGKGLYRLTPLLHGIKSSWFSCTAFGITSPLAALIQYSKISSPISAIVFSPSMISPASMSMMSPILFASEELVEILIVGQTGLPVGVQRIVMN